MNILQKIVGFFQSTTRYVKQTVLPTAISWIVAQFTIPSWKSAVTYGLAGNSIVYACVSVLVDSLGEPRLKLWEYIDGDEKDKEVITDSDLARLLRKPNRYQSQSQFIRLLSTMLAVGGGVFIAKLRNKAGRVVELYPFSVGQVQAIPGTNTDEGFIRGFEIYLGDGNERVFVSPRDMFAIFFMTNPQKPHEPISPIYAAAKFIDFDSELVTYSFSTLKNGAIPGVVVTLADGEILTEETATRLREKWHQSFGGSNRREVAFLQSGMKAEVVGSKLSELSIGDLTRVPESRIAAALRVPPILANLWVGLEKSSYANFETALDAFTRLTLMPLWRMIADIFTFNLLNEFGLDDSLFEISFDTSEIMALAEEQDAIWSRVSVAWQSNLIDRAQAKRMIGLDPEPSDEGTYYSATTSAGMTLPDADQNASDESCDEDDQNDNPDDSQNEAGHRHSPEVKVAGINAEKLELLRAVVKMKQMARVVQADRMAVDINRYNATTANRVVSRLIEMAKGMTRVLETKIAAEDLLLPEDDDALEAIFRTYFIQVATVTWDLDNMLLGVSTSLDLADPAVAELMRTSSKKVVRINEVTREALRGVLREGAARGWSIDHLIRGDADLGVPGIRDVVYEYYKNRAENIARTEMAMAQNEVTAARYAAAGVEKVMIFDGGDLDSDEDCNLLNETIQTLDWFTANPIDHPRCARAAGAII